MRFIGADAMPYFVYNTEVVGVVVAHDFDRAEFVAQLLLFPPHQTLLRSRGSLRKCVSSYAPTRGDGAAAAPPIDFEVITALPWEMRARGAGVLITAPARMIGDAAHQFPPAGGFGMNTSIGDAHNLAEARAGAAQQGNIEGKGKGKGNGDGEKRPRVLVSGSCAATASRRRGYRRARLALHLYDRTLAVPRAWGCPRGAAATGGGAQACWCARWRPVRGLAAIGECGDGHRHGWYRQQSVARSENGGAGRHSAARVFAARPWRRWR